MVTGNINLLLIGMLILGHAAAAMFFLRFWKLSHERLFLYFSIAFWLLTIERIVLGLTPRLVENQSYLYSIRLVAFLIIIYAIFEKNLNSRSKKKA